LEISDVKEVVMLKRKGFGLDDVKKWRENGFELGKLIDYLSLDFGFQEAIEWQSLEVEAKKQVSGENIFLMRIQLSCGWKKDLRQMKLKNFQA
jgi:hypothetical protein